MRSTSSSWPSAEPSLLKGSLLISPHILLASPNGDSIVPIALNIILRLKAASASITGCHLSWELPVLRGICHEYDVKKLGISLAVDADKR